MNVFEKGVVAKADYVWFGWLLFLVVFAMSVFIIAPDKPYGSVYTTLGTITFILIALGVISLKVSGLRALPFSFVVFGNTTEKSFWRDVIVGIAVSFVLVYGIVFSAKQILSPLNVPPLSVVGMGALGAIFSISLLVAEYEETFRNSTLLPTFINWLNQTSANIVFVIIGFLAYVIFNQTGLGLILAGVGVLGFVSKGFSKMLDNKIIKLGLSFVICAIIFAGLHFLAYSNEAQAKGLPVESLLFSAFAAALLFDLTSYFLESGISNRVAHATNNAVFSAYLVGISAWYGFIITAVYVGILYGIFKAGQGMKVV